MNLRVGNTDESDVPPPFEASQKFGVFKLFSVNSTEAVMDKDDVHFDFRISFIVDNGSDNELVMSTIVKINTKFGKIYMFYQHLILILIGHRPGKVT